MGEFEGKKIECKVQQEPRVVARGRIKIKIKVATEAAGRTARIGIAVQVVEVAMIGAGVEETTEVAVVTSGRIPTEVAPGPVVVAPLGMTVAAVMIRGEKPAEARRKRIGGKVEISRKAIQEVAR